MNLKHKIRLNITRPDGIQEEVLNGGEKTIRNRFLSRLLGNQIGVLVLSPGKSVETIEIREIKADMDRMQDE